MKRLVGCGLLLTAATLVASVEIAMAQHAHGGMKTTNVLFAAQLDAKQVVGGSASTATGTGAFLIDRTQRSIAYNLTYEGLGSGGAKSIALHNFGAGKNGEVVKVICGGDASPCPAGASATITGRIDRDIGRPFDNNLSGEFASERIYVEIVGTDGKPEIRGQLAANSAMVMVMNYVANLTPVDGAASQGTGTAIVSETHLPDGKVAVFYSATVAGTSGAPTNAAMVSGPTPAARTFSTKSALPRLQMLSARDKKTGGSLRGNYQANMAAPTALLATRLTTADNAGESGIVVTTGRFPRGELYGKLVPVQ